MKLYRLKQKSGFTLTECLVAIALFAIMSLILFQTLAFCLKQKQINSETVENMNEQIEQIAAGDVYTKSADVIDSNFKIEFNGGIEIEGEANAYYDESGILRITRPEFDSSAAEFAVIEANFSSGAYDGNSLSSGSKFFSSLPVFIERAPPDPNLLSTVEQLEPLKNAGSNAGDSTDLNVSSETGAGTVTWKFTFIYDTPTSNYVCFALLPDGASKVRVLEATNCRAHRMDADGDEAVRFMSLEGNSASVTISFEIEPSDYKTVARHFGAGGGFNAKIIELVESNDDSKKGNYFAG